MEGEIDSRNKKIIDKEKYIQLFLEADPDRGVVEKYLKDAEVYGIFKNDKLLFEKQLERLEKYIRLGFDVYSYIILTSKECFDIKNKICKLMDRLQEISFFLPLRIVPIKIEKFSTILNRMNDERDKAIKNQYHVLDIWNEEIKKRFSEEEINTNIAELKI